MTPMYVKELTNWLTWFNYHRSTMENSPLERKVEFQAKCIQGLFTLLASLSDEVDAANSPKIALPIGLRLHEGIRSND